MAGNEPQSEAPSSAAGEVSVGPGSRFDRLLAWLRSLAVTFVAIAIVSLMVLALAHYVGDNKAAVLAFQNRLFQAVRNASPLALVDVMFGDIGGYFAAPVRWSVDALFGALGGAIDWLQASLELPPVLRPLPYLIVFPLMLVAVVIEVAIVFVILALAVVLAPIVLPVAFLLKRSVFDALIVLLVYLPSVWTIARLVVRADFEGNAGLKLAVFWYGMVAALLVTTLFYFLLQMAMLASLWIFGRLVPLAPTGVAVSAVVAFVWQCAVKTVDSLMTTQVEVVLRRLMALVTRSA